MKKMVLRKGAYITTPGSVKKKARLHGKIFQDIHLATGLSLTTINKADKGGPSTLTTLNAIGTYLGKTSWAYFLSDKHHASIKFEAAEFVKAVDEGEEFAGLREIGIRLMVSDSFAHPRVEKIARKLKKLCKVAQQNPAVAFHALWQHYIVRGDYQVALGVAVTMRKRARSISAQAHAERALGESRFYLGKFRKAIKHLQHASIGKLSSGDGEDEPLALDTQVAAYGHLAIALAICGKINQALVRSEKAIIRAKELEHIPSHIFACHCNSVLHLLLSDPAKASQNAEMVHTLTQDSHFPLFEALSKIVSGWAQLKLGKAVTMDSLFKAFAESRQVFNRASRPLWLSLLAECLQSKNETSMAAHLLDDAVEAQKTTGDAFYAAEVFRLRASLILSDRSSKQKKIAFEYLRTGIKIAENQSARLYQLRSAQMYYLHSTNSKDKKFAREKMKVALQGISGQNVDVSVAQKTLRRKR